MLYNYTETGRENMSVGIDKSAYKPAYKKCLL